MYLLASMFPEKRVMEITMGIIMVVTMAVTIIRIDSIIEDDIIKRNHHLSLWDLVRSLGVFLCFLAICVIKPKPLFFLKVHIIIKDIIEKKKIRFGMDIFHNKNDCKNHFLEHLGVQGILILRLIFKNILITSYF